MGGPQSSFHLVPYMFNRVEVRADCRPGSQDIKTILVQKVLGKDSTMCGCIILLECGVAIAGKAREQVGPEHLGNVSPCSQVAIDEDEWSAASACDRSLRHHTPPVTDRTNTVG